MLSTDDQLKREALLWQNDPASPDATYLAVWNYSHHLAVLIVVVLSVNQILNCVDLFISYMRMQFQRLPKRVIMVGLLKWCR